MAQVVTTILLDDNPKGLRHIEMANWAGEAFVVPRAQLKELRQRKEVKRPGVYFLFGEGKEKPSVYIGQSENVINRLASHDADRGAEEWNEAVVFVRTLDGALIKYLESNAVYYAKKANRCEVHNAVDPKRNKLSEAQKIQADEYLRRIKTIVGLFGYRVFDDPKEQQVSTEYYFEDARNKDGLGKGSLLSTGEFIVFAGSLSRRQETKSFRGSGPSLRRRLIDEGVLKNKSDKSYEFTRDYVFSSPSAASDTVAGRSTNGWTCWKDKEGRTLDENVRK